MTTPLPIEYQQMAGESYVQWQYRLQQLNPPTTGWNQTAAETFLDPIVHTVPAPRGWDIK